MALAAMLTRRGALALAALLVGICASAARADDDVKTRIAAAGGTDRYDSDVVVVLDHKDVNVRPNGLGVAREHRVVKILKDGGVRSESVQRFPFDPNTNRLDLKAVRIYRQGGEVEEIPVDQPPRQPQTAWGIFWPSDQYLVTAPALRAGDAVETISEMTGFNVAYLADDGFDDRNAYGKTLEPPVPGHWHDEVHFWSGVPIIEKRYSVRIPKDKPLQYEVYNGELTTSVLLEGDELVYTFEKKDIAPFKGESSMESAPNVAPKLLLATLPTWQDKARWLHEVSEPQFEADDAIRAKVAEITANCRTDEEKYTALNHWVAENIRYAGTSRGMCEGYTIHRSIETFRDRCGVCKDKAGLLVTFLRVAGFDSFLVMTMARQRVDRVPADQFNHAVTCIRYPDGQLKLLDPTWMPKSRDNWSTLEPLQHVVYGLPEGKELSQSPYFPPEDNQAIWKAVTAVDSNNRLSGSLEFVATGAPEGRLRRTLAGRHPADRAALFAHSFQSLSPLTQTTNLSCTDPVDFSGPFTLRCDLEAPAYALGNGGRRYLRLPMLQTVLGDRVIYDIRGQSSADKREYGVKLLATRLVRIEETLKLPADWKPLNLPEPVALDGPSASLHFEVESQPGQIHYTCELQLKHWTIPPDEYANFKEVMTKFDELCSATVAFDMEAAHAMR